MSEMINELLNTRLSMTQLLHHFSEIGRVDVIRALIESGTDVNLKDPDEDTALHAGCRGKYADAIFFLLETRIDVNAQNIVGPTALHIGCGYGNTNVITPLIEAGIDMNATNNIGNTALTEAIVSKSAKCTKLLIDSGCDIEENQFQNDFVRIALASNVDRRAEARKALEDIHFEDIVNINKVLDVLFRPKN